MDAAMYEPRTWGTNFRIGASKRSLGLQLDDEQQTTHNMSRVYKDIVGERGRSETDRHTETGTHRSERREHTRSIFDTLLRIRWPSDGPTQMSSACLIAQPALVESRIGTQKSYCTARNHSAAHSMHVCGHTPTPCKSQQTTEK